MGTIIAVKDYNAAILQRIRVKCVEKGTSIPKIEKALGYGNGAISSWKNAKRVAPMERVQAIADYLSVPVESLIENISADGQKKKGSPFIVNSKPVDFDIQIDDGLTEKQRDLINLVAELPDNVVSLLLSAAKDWLKNQQSSDSV